MKCTVFANGRGVVHRQSGGASVVFPDVCKTPMPGGPVPIPYPNTGKASDTSKGPKNVSVDGCMPMVEGAQYSRSYGDEPGTAGGVISGSNRGPCEFMNFSFNVKFAGKNVCRLGDPLFHNKKNIGG
ncbi:DUF4150 domain-containing protein [Nannocystis punicea]|uniref:DUF4150 domain-containing protein n=1 Tax=Nannocystis punicea TaxID=2995304 RepID=A0ABY7H6T1_9BACT|nr:DUF4150 domain-containing protein [Nannocystis poenicansa]WAS94863.1 DUF4150 domain-containing protein [Nannocystis poenicansa]